MTDRMLPFAMLTIATALAANTAGAQTAPPPLDTNPIDVRTAAQIDKQAHEFLEQARTKPDGSVSTTLERYPGHYTMLTARTKPGGAELHKNFNDFFIVLDGEATEVTGGTIEDAKETSPGEIRGKRVVGGTEHPMHKGDVIHIAPGTPHQTIVPEGKYFLYYVIKVQAPVGDLPTTTGAR
jgi:mannose-6-phosphate isomerase-like protein (cupin superfamily)